MQNVTLTRHSTGLTGTHGLAVIDATPHSFDSLELQDLDNAPDISCIPDGVYTCSIRNSPHLSPMFGYDPYEVLNVPGRSSIFIHPGNWAGSVAAGMKCSFEGCIGLGTVAEDVEGQDGIGNSKYAVAQFMSLLGNEDFTLTIVTNYAPAQAAS